MTVYVYNSCMNVIYYFFEAMKKFLVLLLVVFCLGSLAVAQWSYRISDSKKNVSKAIPLERILDSESKYYNAKFVKRINSLIWVYLKNWDSAYRNWNYSLAIKNYELAIKKLEGIRWAEYFIKKIEQRIAEIKKLYPQSWKIRPIINSKSSNYKNTRKYPITRG